RAEVLGFFLHRGRLRQHREEGRRRQGRGPGRRRRPGHEPVGRRRLGIHEESPARRLQASFGSRFEVRNKPTTPKTPGYRMPAEWAPQEAIWLSWPHDPESFGKGLPKVEQAYATLIKEIQKSERVELFIVDPMMQKRASSMIARAGADMSRVTFHGFPY